VYFRTCATRGGNCTLVPVLAYSTAPRTSQIGIGIAIGIRMALGATRGSVVRTVVMEVLWLAGIAAAAALPLSLLFGMPLRNQLFGIPAAIHCL
jgi:predicted lysophospholipase L1 biosynthesis ABC-type transport system permease subunit